MYFSEKWLEKISQKKPPKNQQSKSSQNNNYDICTAAALCISNIIENI
jgi:hypothetical protein